MKNAEDSLPAFFRLTRRFPGVFLKLEPVQKVLRSLQAAEGHQYHLRLEEGSFVQLLQPSPSMHQALQLLLSQSAGTTTLLVGGYEDINEEEGGGSLQGVIRMLEKMSGALKVPSSPGEIEARLSQFEDEIGMPVEGRGTLNTLISSPDVRLEAIVLFLAAYFDAAPPSTRMISSRP